MKMSNRPATSPGSFREKEAALEKAMDACGSYILWYLNSLCRDQQLAEDLSSQLWVYVYNKYAIGDYQHIGYLKRKAYQIYATEMRKRKVRDFVQFVEHVPNPDVPAKMEEPANMEEEQNLHKEFWRLFIPPLEIPERNRQIFWLHARYGYTMQEIGKKLGIAHSTAHDWYQKTRQQCRDHLQQPQCNA